MKQSPPEARQECWHPILREIMSLQFIFIGDRVTMLNSQETWARKNINNDGKLFMQAGQRVQTHAPWNDRVGTIIRFYQPWTQSSVVRWQRNWHKNRITLNGQGNSSIATGLASRPMLDHRSRHGTRSPINSSAICIWRSSHYWGHSAGVGEDF